MADGSAEEHPGAPVLAEPKEGPAPKDAPSPAARGWALAGLLVVTTLVFGTSLAGDFLWDDVPLIQGNRNIRDPAQLWTALTHDFWYVSSLGESGKLQDRYYRPVVTLAYAAEFRAFGEDPIGYHVVNVVLHLGCVVLVFLWLSLRIGRRDTTGTMAVVLGAGLFALHPSRPESVAWISGGTDLWMTLFFLGGLLAWERLRGAARLATSSACFVLATLSKEVAVVAPVVLALDTWIGDRDPQDRRDRFWGVGAIGLAVVAVLVLRSVVVSLPDTDFWAEGLGGSVERVLSSLGHYMRMAVWHVPSTIQAACQSFDETGLPAYDGWSIAVGALVVVGLMGLVAAAWRHRAARPWLADVLLFVVPLAPVLNLLPMRMDVLVAARFLYLPLLGLSAMLARAAAAGIARGRRMRLVVFSGAALVVGGSAMISLIQIPYFRSDDALWKHERELDPDNSCATTNLVATLRKEGRFAEALELIEQAFQTHGLHPRTRSGLVLAAASTLAYSVPDADQVTLRQLRNFYDDIGAGRPATFEARGIKASYDPPIQIRKEVLKSGPEYLVPRAVVYGRTLDLPEAERQLRRIVERDPRSALAWGNLALVCGRQEEWNDALDVVNRALQQKPGDTMLLSLRQRILRAEALMTRLRGADPADVAVARASVFISLGAPGLARQVLDPLIPARLDRPDLVLTRVLADEAEGQFDLAREILRSAEARDPAHASFWQEAARRLSEDEQAWRQQRTTGGTR